MESLASADLTTSELLESYWRVHWPSFSPSQRCKLRGRLIVMAGCLLDDPRATKRVVRALGRQRANLGAARPEPASRDAWVARYLIDSFLPAPHDFATSGTAKLAPELVRASDWLAAHSKPVGEITDEDLMQLRTALGGKAFHTRRTYWASVESVLHWALTSGRMSHDPSLGLPRLRRDLHAERTDPDRVPTEEEVWYLAQLGREYVGEWFGAAVLLGSFAALRVGELVALRRTDLSFTTEGGLWVTVSTQRRTFPRRHSDDGISTHDYAPPKGRSTAMAGRRRCYIPSQAAQEIRKYVDIRTNNELLFLNFRRNPLGTESFRGSWKRVLDTLPLGHRLRDITPHSMRHAGMSMWLRKGLDLKLIQSWGGWHSLKVMLDTYAALLPGAEEESIALLEGLKEASGSPSGTQRRVAL
jgi:integrase